MKIPGHFSAAINNPVALGKEFVPAPGFKAIFWNAGHILGSASVELRCGDTRLLFSGDLGPSNKAFHPAPSAPSGFDHIFCESTYGDRERENITIDRRRTLLLAEIAAARNRGGNLVIPVFALERTQELLLDLSEIIASGQFPGLNIFIDSPLATRATEVFVKYGDLLEDIPGDLPFQIPSFHFVEDVAKSRALNTMTGAVILAGSGMCEGGRVRYHLLANLPRRESTVLFVGFQAGGTLGRTLLEGAERVRISGRDVAVRATVRHMDSYSAHADRSKLLEWIQARRPVEGSLFLTHGEPPAITSLHDALALDIPSIHMPDIGDVYALPKGAPAHRLRAGRKDLSEIAGHDWQNDYASFAVDLKKSLAAIEASKRQEAIVRMRGILSDYKKMRQHHTR